MGSGVRMNPHTFEILRLGPNDLGRMRELNAMFGEAFRDSESYGKAPPSDGYLQKLLASEDFIALATLAESNVVGGIAAYVLRKFEQERSEVYIYDLAVSESHRRRGIATAMIEELKRVAASLGAYVIYVQADLVDEPAIALYTKLGLREDVLHFDIEVPQK